jgi:hypothetical protein
MLMSNWWDDPLATETIKPVSGESTKETVKTIRVRECRVIPACTCGD